MTAYFFETHEPSEPKCHVISMPALRWASKIALGHDFVADPVEPKVIGLEKPYKRLRDFLLTGVGGGELTVSQRVRDAVEEVEPGVHQFLPVELRQPDGSAFPMPYWGLNIRHHVDCYVWGRHSYIVEAYRTLPNPHRDAPKVRLYFPREPGDLVLKASAIAGLHLWRERRSNTGVFISGAILAAFTRHGVNAYRAGEVTLV